MYFFTYKMCLFLHEKYHHIKYQKKRLLINEKITLQMSKNSKKCI